ncbi:hypothetical protein ACHAPT_013263 [Fusarium lateritium]
MAVKSGRITFLGNDDCMKQYIGPNTTVFDLKGRMAMPGLADAHLHLLGGGAWLLKCSMNYQLLDLDEVLDHIQKCLDEDEDKGDDDWLELIALDYYILDESSGGVIKKDLDKFKMKRLIVVASADGHSFWANSITLKASGITSSTRNPKGGVLERITGSREPSGIPQDNANLLSGPAQTTAQNNIKSIRAALKILCEEGVTAFQDAASTDTVAQAVAAVKKEGGLSARAYFDYRIDAPKSSKDVNSLVKSVLNITSTYYRANDIISVPTVKWQAVKIFADGVILYPANTGALLEPYWMPVGNGSVWKPDPERRPEPYWSKQRMIEVLTLLFQNKIDAQIHVDGNLAVRTALDAIEAIRKKHPELDDYRLGLAHNELTDLSDWPRFAELKADPIMSFQWAQASSVCIPNAYKNIGPERSNYLEAWGDIARFGPWILHGSDWPVDPLDEWLAIKVSVTRSGDPENTNSPASFGGKYNVTGLPGLTLTWDQAIRAITTESSRFLRADMHIGSLELGKLADVIILKANYFEVPEDELARQKTLMTMVGGEVI